MNMIQHPRFPHIWVTPCGRVFEELEASKDGNGYGLVSISSDGSKRIRLRRHVIVCETYHGERPEGKVVRHKNGTPSDDRSENLEWGTQAENCKDTVTHGRSTRGIKNAQAKLTREQALEIRQRSRNGESTTELARWFNVSQPTICDIKAGRTWSHLEEETP